ncbi:hypothetical protein BH11MYX3_BH11MYX3_18240 [soil metagenome]
MRVLVVVVLLAGTAHADRPLHGSLGIGGALVETGSRGDRFRLEAQLDLKPRSRYGFLLAWRAFDQDHHGLVTAGLNFEGGAARPRLVLDLHVDAGVDLDHSAPLVGAGLRATVGIIGPTAVVLDGGGYLVIDGLDNTRMQLQTALLLAARW